MLRVNKIALREIEGVLFYKGEPFNGIVFSLNDGILIDAFKCESGFRKEEYSFQYFSNITETTTVVDMDILEAENDDDYEAFQCLNGNRFSGVALEFDGDFCTGEIFFVRGWSDSQITYFQSGKLDSVELIEERFSQIYQWHDSGQLKRFEISERDSFSISLAFNSVGEFSAFGLEGDYFEKIKRVIKKIKLPLYTDKTSVYKLTSGSFASLSGSAFNDDIFKIMSLKGCFNKTQNIVLHTAMTKKSFSNLKDLNHLVRLVINSNSLELKDAKNLKLAKPNCYIEFKGQEITV
ncbi:hypothetical protein ACPUEK_17920 [Marinomonas gallaica]|uniref:hypothetical protein n=1 Tax=Marinomonas gallaica TaxID=1806667 RepID=UPI003CE4B672